MTIKVVYNNGIDMEFNNINDIFDENQLNIIELNCSWNSLKKLPIKIGNLINLQKFWCNDNQLEYLPVELSNLINLQFFSFHVVWLITNLVLIGLETKICIKLPPNSLISSIAEGIPFLIDICAP